MKKFLLLFVIFICFKTANAQLEFYEFAFNIYDNGERIADTNKFQIYLHATDRKTGAVTNFPYLKPSSDTSRTYGFDYRFVEAGDMFYNYIVEIRIAKVQEDVSQNSKDMMKIIFDCKKSSPWVTLAMDKVDYKNGIFKITENEWPDNRRDRPMNNRYFPYLDENFNWESVRVK